MMRRILNWLRILIPLFTAIFILYGMFTADELSVTISLDKDWDTILFSALAFSLFTVAMIQLINSNAEIMRQQSLKQAYQDAEADMNRFLKRLDHELKNPLTAIRVTLANLDEEAAPDDLVTIHNTLDTHTKRLAHLVRDLRVIADLGTMPLSLASIKITDLIDEVVLIAQENLGEKSIKILSIDVDKIPLIQGDFDLLSTAFYNLIENSIKYTGERGSIRISFFYEEAEAMVSVRIKDDGQGIPEKDLPYIWDELYRSENVRGIAGSGIGLALVKRIIDKHGGEIRMESRVGIGTTVIISLPTPLDSNSKSKTKTL